MGGYGSSRWRGHSRRQTVDEVACLSTQCIVAHLPGGGQCRCETTTGARGGCIVVSARELGGAGQCTLIALGTQWPAARLAAVELQHVNTPFNGVRYRLVCPGCRRRRDDLYACSPSDSVRWMCRVCLRLCYRTQRLNPFSRAAYRMKRLETLVVTIPHRTRRHAVERRQWSLAARRYDEMWVERGLAILGRFDHDETLHSEET